MNFPSVSALVHRLRRWRHKCLLKEELRMDLEDHYVLVFALAKNNLKTDGVMTYSDIEKKYLAQGLTKEEIKDVDAGITPIELYF